MLRFGSPALVLFLSLAACVHREPATSDRAIPHFDDAFWKHWNDGLAELSGYELTQPRYGELRQGVAVLVFVTEPFSETLRVKADPGKHSPDDVFQVMKLNLAEDFQTGIYDYNLMTSAFVALGPHASGNPGAPTKVSFSAQEWGGHVYQQVLFDTRRLRDVSHSYFDGESDRMEDLPYPQGGVSADVLWHWARGFAGPVLERGQSITVPYLQSLKEARLQHQALGWKTATLEHQAATKTMDTPLGLMEAEVMTVRPAQGPSRTFYVEVAWPHRMLGWEASDGERATLLGTTRIAYWQEHQQGDEALLEKLGLKRRALRSP